jgi:AraC family transcriptional regulator of adaptative response/methylated-DNA-[protein]-cysteine methyltransferase
VRGRQGEGPARLAYGITRCSLGWLLVAATRQGVCAIDVGDHPTVLRTRLGKTFAGARLRLDARTVRPWLKAAARFVDAPTRNLELPLAPRGTAFQHRVWNVLRRLPVGATISYTALARRIGRPRAIRAVGRACAANRIALAIPCHRVLRSDGEVSGYRWGVERKRTLLRRERAVAASPPRRSSVGWTARRSVGWTARRTRRG